MTSAELMTKSTGVFDSEEFDVVLCGGGLSALVLTRQLQLDHPELSVLVLDAAHPQPADTMQKAGESILEGASYHFRHTLGLADYLFKNQVPKFGLRFFFNGGEQRFSDRLEYGGVQWPPFATFQLDRGLLEEELRRLVVASGAIVLRGHRIHHIDLASDAGHTSGAHRVTGTAQGTEFVCRGRWLIDATGRRRMLTSQLGLTAKYGHAVSASWWWVDGKVDVERLVGPDDLAWRRRVGPPRWHSTVHLAGEGYWMWIIPLASGKTSIGIVSDSTHPIADRRSFTGALAWCRRHEPQFAELVADRAPLEYRVLRDLSYAASQVFSEERWACVGDAAVLVDPLYGFGNDLICHASSIVSMLIGLDRERRLTAQRVAEANRFFLTMVEVIQSQYLRTYRTLGSSALYTQKLAWDSSMYFAVLQQTLMQNMYDDPDSIAPATNVLDQLLLLSRAMQRLFIQSVERDGLLHSIRGMRTWAPRVTALADSSLDKCVGRQFPDFLRQRLSYLEGIAAVLFSEVVHLTPSIAPEHRSRLLEAETGINPYAASLDPLRWRSDGVFDARRPNSSLNIPAQFDASLRTEAEQRDYRLLHSSVLDAAAKFPERLAIYDVDRSVTLDELAACGLAQTRDIPRTATGCLAIDVPDVVDGAIVQLAALAAGQPYVNIDPAWTASERAAVKDRLGVTATITRGRGLCELGRAAPRQPKASGARDVGPDDVALTEVRFSPYGARLVPYSHVQLFRMASWLARLLRARADESARATCIWLGRAQVELLVPLLAGLEVVTQAAWRSGLVDPTSLSADPVLMGRPADLAALLSSGWVPDGVSVFSIGDPLSRSLSRTLRSSARRVCDFGYASFSHEVWDPYID
jgi:flavin-dependent dehydrogenase